MHISRFTNYVIHRQCGFNFLTTAMYACAAADKDYMLIVIQNPSE